VLAWRDAVVDRDFHFCFKLPAAATHHRHIDRHVITEFCRQIEPLQNNLGPLLVQFPGNVGPAQLSHIEHVFAQLPDHLRSVLEVRHPAWFTQHKKLSPLLYKYGAGLAVMDSRAIFNGNRNHPEVLSALHEKPDVPVWNQVFNKLMFVRLLLHPDRISNSPYIEQWIGRTVKALTGGCDVYMMIHCPNNQHCPEMALQFHNRLRTELGSVAALKHWPVPQQSVLI
jgi:uncharacterized protein YecE (DUF72 family)